VKVPVTYLILGNCMGCLSFESRIRQSQAILASVIDDAHRLAEMRTGLQMRWRAKRSTEGWKPGIWPSKCGSGTGSGQLTRSGIMLTNCER
jgi:hypothetical protein